MSRGIGEFGPIREFVPEWMAVLLALVTQLGDVWFLSLVVALTYWYQTSQRENVAVIIGMTLTGFAVIHWLKRIFALPRPEQPVVAVETLPAIIQPLYEATGTATGYGFPSGHAFMTTIVYLSLVDVLSLGTRRHRFGGALVLIAIVCFSRVALGVHYLVDVVAGVGFGLLLLAFVKTLLTYRLIDRGTAVFGLAVVASGLNLLSNGPDPNALLLFGASLGALGGWQLVLCGRLVSAHQTSSLPASVPLFVRGGIAVIVIASIVSVIVLFPLFSAPARGAITGLGVGGVITLPVFRQSEYADEVGPALAFWRG